MYRFILPAVLLLAGTSALSADSYRARQQAEDNVALVKALDGYTQGRTSDCINPRRINETKRIGDKILYKVSRREFFLTDTGGGCFGLRHGDAIITNTFSSQFCRGDIVRTVDLPARFPSGSCTFGDFTQYTRAQ